MSDELFQITQNGYAQTRALNDEALAGIQRRRARTMRELLDSTQRENENLLREQHALREENRLAVELARHLFDNCEAFRRMSNYLRRAWRPDDPNELPLKQDLGPLFETKRSALAHDADWVKAREADLQARVRPGKPANPTR